MRVCWRSRVVLSIRNEERQLRQQRDALSVVALRRLIVQRARGRCEYCLAPQRVCGYRFHLDHIIPLARGGFDNPPNRALACAPCNLAKADKVSGLDPRSRHICSLFNPRTQLWHEHFRWASDSLTVIDLTPAGRATIAVLNLNSALRKRARRLWVSAGLFP